MEKCSEEKNKKQCGLCELAVKYISTDGRVFSCVLALAA